MKKGMILVVCMSTALVHGMKNPNTLSFLIGQTVVKLTKCRIYEVAPVDLMVVGEVQQRTLKIRPTASGDSHEVGIIKDDDIKNYNYMVYLKDKDVDSDSDDDTYKPYDMYEIGEKRLWKHAHAEYIKSRVISVLEPRIMLRHQYDKQLKGFVNGFHYYAHQKSLDGEHEYENVECDGGEAITQALQDLGFCYQQALSEGWQRIDKADKSIALSAFGIDVGIPREKAASVAVATVIDFIKNSPEKFVLIHLFLKRQSDFERYKELLEVHVAEQK